MRNFRLILILSLLLPFAFLSCNDDDKSDSVPYGYNPTKGVWQPENNVETRYLMNKDFQIWEGHKIESTGDWSYNLIYPRYRIGWTTFTIIDDNAVEVGKWDYEVQNNAGKYTLNIRKNKSNENWTKFIKIDEID